MGEPEEPPAPVDPRKRTLPLAEIVPARAVLTELARGFLLVQQSNPEHAREFARTFLKERSAPTAPTRILPTSELARVRRGVHAAYRDGPPP